jgi:hypothetical protein
VVNGLETVFDSDVKRESNILKTRLATGASNCRLAWKVSPRQEHFLFFAKRNGSVAVITGMAFTPRTRPCTSSLRDQCLRIFPTNFGSCASIRSNGGSPPDTNKDIEDRQNELMGNLSLNKELDFIMKVNEWIKKPEYKNDNFVKGKSQ